MDGMTRGLDPATTGASLARGDRTRGRSVAGKANVLGVGVHAIDMRQAVERITHALETRRKGYVCVTGVHGVMEAQRDAGLKSILNRAFLNVPDGMPTVWVGQLQGHRKMDRVFGPELMQEICRLSPRRGYTHFLYGGAPGVAQELERSLRERFAGLSVVGTYTPPYRDLDARESEELARRVAERRPDVVWVGLSTPRQERFVAEMLPRLDTTLMIAVGAAFDYHTGRIADAPRWVKRSGLQWAHRLAQDPQRLWRRYASNNPRFLLSLSLQLLGIRRHRLDDSPATEAPEDPLLRVGRDTGWSRSVSK